MPLYLRIFLSILSFVSAKANYVFAVSTASSCCLPVMSCCIEFLCIFPWLSGRGINRCDDVMNDSGIRGAYFSEPCLEM